MSPNARHELIRLPIPTRDGRFLASYSKKGLASLNFPSFRNGQAPSTNSAASPEIRRWHRATTRALERALEGRSPKVLPPLDVSAGTAFQKRVWAAMRRIACGKTIAYGELARAIGNPKAVRAVGGACGANPVPVLVPCHRVLAANGKIGGFSGGRSWKKTLLSREGVNL